MLLSSCAISHKQTSIDLTCDDFYATPHIANEVQIPVDCTVTIALCSNPSTGFQWEPTVCCPLRSVILAEIDYKFVQPEKTESIPPTVGAPGKEVWVYKGVNQGVATVSLDYRRPGRTGERGEWTYSLTVVVE